MVRLIKNLSLVLLVLLLVSGFSFAQQEAEEKEVKVKKEIAVCKKEMMPQMMQMMPMMMGRADFQIAKDAIFVLKGNYLMKYDLNLNLVKKVELPKMEMPMMKHMQQMMQMMHKECCPMKKTEKEEKKP